MCMCYSMSTKGESGSFGTVEITTLLDKNKNKHRVAKKTFNKQENSNIENCVDEFEIHTKIRDALKHNQQALKSVFLAVTKGHNCHGESPHFYMGTCSTDGTSLANWMKNAPDRAKTKVAIKLLQAIQALHNSNVSHNDIKPGNIMVCTGEVESPGVRLIDFGYAITDHPKVASHSSEKPVGTPEYMSPFSVTDVVNDDICFCGFFWPTRHRTSASLQWV